MSGEGGVPKGQKGTSCIPRTKRRSRHERAGGGSRTGPCFTTEKYTTSRFCLCLCSPASGGWVGRGGGGDQLHCNAPTKYQLKMLWGFWALAFSSQTTEALGASGLASSRGTGGGRTAHDQAQVGGQGRNPPYTRLCMLW